MASIENILAVRIGEEQIMGTAIDTGLRAVLAAQYIIADIQT